MSTDDFRAHLRAIIGPQPKPTPAERPCVRTPADAGYYPPFDAKREHERDLEHESREAFRQLEMGGA
jgi:hypothetical protein